MLAVTGILSVLAGSALASSSRRFPTHGRAIEVGAGFLLIIGLALTSCALPAML
jgi:cytochrome c biogenesis protein CcdA